MYFDTNSIFNDQPALIIQWFVKESEKFMRVQYLTLGLKIYEQDL